MTIIYFQICLYQNIFSMTPLMIAINPQVRKCKHEKWQSKNTSKHLHIWIYSNINGATTSWTISQMSWTGRPGGSVGKTTVWSRPLLKIRCGKNKKRTKRENKKNRAPPTHATTRPCLLMNLKFMEFLLTNFASTNSFSTKSTSNTPLHFPFQLPSSSFHLQISSL